MVRVMHVADFHLGWSPRQLPAEQAERVRVRRDGLLTQAVDFALAEHVDLFVIAGDLFDSYRPRPDLVAAVQRDLQRLLDAGIVTITVPGNHDELTYPGSVYQRERASWPGLLVTAPEPTVVATFDVRGTRVGVTALAYVGGVTPTREPLRDFPRDSAADVSIAVLHGTLAYGQTRAGEPFSGERSLPIDRRALQTAGFAYVALGHLHAATEVALDGGGVAAYAGCVAGKGPSDPAVGHWTLVDILPGVVRRIGPPADVAPVWQRDVDVTPFENRDDLVAHCRSLGAPDAWARIRLFGALAFALDVDALQSLAADAFLHLEIEDATTSMPADLLDHWASQPTIRGAFVRDMRARLAAASDDEARRLIVRALRYGLDAMAGGGS